MPDEAPNPPMCSQELYTHLQFWCTPRVDTTSATLIDLEKLWFDSQLRKLRLLVSRLKLGAPIHNPRTSGAMDWSGTMYPIPWRKTRGIGNDHTGGASMPSTTHPQWLGATSHLLCHGSTLLQWLYSRSRGCHKRKISACGGQMMV